MNLDGKVPVLPRSATARVQPSPQRMSLGMNVNTNIPAGAKSSPVRPVKATTTVSPVNIKPNPSPVNIKPNPSPVNANSKESGGISATPKKSQQSAKQSKYTDAEISSLLADGYTKIQKDQWDYIPSGAHLRFFKIDDGTPKNTRFRPGGYVKTHIVAADGRKMFMMETKRGGHDGDGYIKYPMAYEDLAEVWKRYPQDSFIEMTMLYKILAQKQKQIDELVKRVESLESRIPIKDLDNN